MIMDCICGLIRISLRNVGSHGKNRTTGVEYISRIICDEGW